MLTYVGGKELVLRQNAVNRGTETGELDLLGDIAEDVVDGKVGAYAVTDGPAFYLVAYSEDLAGHVGAGDDIVFLAKGVLTLCHNEVTILAEIRERMITGLILA